MRSNDRKEQEKSDAKNALEEYVYAIRDKVQGGPIEGFMEEAAREAYCSKLTSMEDWLYEDGEDEEKSVYAAKLKELKDVGDAVELRAREAETRPAAVENFQKTLVRFRKFIDEQAAGAEKYAHIGEEKMKKASEALAAKDQWFNGFTAKQAGLKQWEDPAATTDELVRELSALEKVVTPIMDTPVPVAEPPKEEAKDDSPAEGAAPADGTAPAAEGDKTATDAEKPAPAPKDEMEID